MLMISPLYIVLLTTYVSFLNELIVNLANRVSYRNNVTHTPISLKKLAITIKHIVNIVTMHVLMYGLLAV